MKMNDDMTKEERFVFEAMNANPYESALEPYKNFMKGSGLDEMDIESRFYKIVRGLTSHYMD